MAKMQGVVLSIGKLEKDAKNWNAVMQNGAGTWRVANADAIPSNKLDDCEYHLFRYSPPDQFCYFVDLPELQAQAEELVGDSEFDGEVLKFLNRLRSHLE